MIAPHAQAAATDSVRDVTCPVCTTGVLRTARVPYEVTFRDCAYTVPDAEVTRCDSCGEVFFAPGQSDALQRTASDMARRGMDLLTGTEIARFRSTLRLTQAQLETALGVPAKTVARWEVGSVLQSRAADRFLRLLIAHPELVEELRAGKTSLTATVRVRHPV
jgi:putative zinc finger/helix-turn-helix YgiT family protein